MQLFMKEYAELWAELYVVGCSINWQSNSRHYRIPVISRCEEHAHQRQLIAKSNWNVIYSLQLNASLLCYLDENGENIR